MQDNNVFREKVVESSIENQVNKPKIEQIGKSITPNDKMGEEENNFKKLDIWEGEKKKKYINEYFGTHNIGHEFVWKMPLSQIDKYIREEIDRREFDKTTVNYSEILAEIEKEIGSDKLTLQKRLQKISQYIQVLKKFRLIREKKESYKSSLSAPSS